MRIYYVVDGVFLAGGQMVNLDHVAALRRFGLDARLWVARPDPGAAPAFPPGREVPWEARPAGLTAEDVLVVGEMHGFGLHAARATPARKLIHNQGPFLTFQVFGDMPEIAAWGCERIICAGHAGAAMLREVGWSGPISVVRPALDPVFRPEPARPRRLAVAVMTRKRALEARFLRGVLRSRHPELMDVPWVAIQDVTREEVAGVLQESEVFLATGEREGLGLPPLEAMACGALVVGFHGHGGREYATPQNGDWFDDGDHLALADALAGRLRALKAGERFDARRAAGFATAGAFSQIRFEAELKACWNEILG